MKWFKTIIGVIIIAAAIAAIYYWNIIGKERLANVSESKQSQIEEVIEISPKQQVINIGKSYFPIENKYIQSRSTLLSQGDVVSIYSANSKESIGTYEIAAIYEDSIEIICTIEEYFKISESDFSELVFVLEDSDG